MKPRRRKNKIAGAFAPRLVEMLQSPAFRVLSLSAHRVLARLEVELANHAGRDNGKLPCTLDHFTEYGIDRHAVAPALRELESLGFIAIKRGRAGCGEWRAPNLYLLTYRHTDEANPSDEWRRIETTGEAEKLARIARAGTNAIRTRTSV